MSLDGRRITIAGGGIAGLAAARAIAEAGASVTLCERAPEIREFGAGLQISPNGLRVLDALGLGGAVRSAGLAAARIRLLDSRDGAEVAALDLTRAAPGYLFLDRGALIGALADGAAEAGVTIRTGAAVSPGDTAPGALTVAADGLHSAHRARLNGGDRPPFTGQVAWRAVVAEDADAPREATVVMGPGRHLVSYPLAGGYRNLVAVEERRDWAEEGWHHPADPDDMRAAFAGFAGPVPDWLSRVETAHLWGLFRHPVAARWHDQGCVLTGDAAHPTLPFLAQGANLALEDAWVLAACLSAAEPEVALPAYQAARRPRVARAIAAANANARNFHLRGVARAVAFTGLRMADRIVPGRVQGRFDWLYRHDVTATHPIPNLKLE